MKLHSNTPLYIAIDKAINIYNQEDINPIIAYMKTNPLIKDYKVATMWHVYHIVYDNDESIKELVKQAREELYINDNHINTMLVDIFTKHKFIL